MLLERKREGREKMNLDPLVCHFPSDHNSPVWVKPTFPIWVTRTQVLGPPCAAFSDPLAGSWSRSGIARTLGILIPTVCQHCPLTVDLLLLAIMGVLQMHTSTYFGMEEISLSVSGAHIKTHINYPSYYSYSLENLTAILISFHS